MRISHFLIYDRLTAALQKNLRKLFKPQEQLSTGKKINRPSDEPLDISRVMGYRVSIKDKEQFKRNMNDAKTYLELTDKTLEQSVNSIKRVQELIITALNGDETPESRKMIAEEVKQLRAHMLGLTNARFRSRYIFSGMLYDKQAFDSSGTYQGDNNYIEVKTTYNLTVKENLTGLEVFAYQQGSEEVVQLEDGRYIHYIQGSGTEVKIEIRDTDDTTVLDSFSFSNTLEQLDRISEALDSNNTDRLTALLKTLDRSMDQMLSKRAEVGARLNFIDNELDSMDDNILKLRTVMSSTEDADITEVVSEIAKTQLALQALRQSGSKVISQSLLDFLG
ncbi:MAG: flagellar hook-associated protein 3 [Nitrospirae bacterium]|nr:flagellar hook-associated protein 3 [Nitrospirota bacterium]